MHKRNEHRFYQTPITMMFLISCLTVMGCYPMGCHNPDWSDKDADFLITQLKNNRFYNLREKAVYLLAGKAQQERDKVIPALTHALLDDYAYVREAAADVLGSIEPPAVSAIPALIETLRAKDTGRTSMLPVHDEWPDVHWTALMSLRNMGPAAAEAIPALTEVFHSDDERYLSIVKDGAGWAIVKIDPSMRGIVIEELIERRAVQPLVWLADDEFLVPVLIQILNDPEAYNEHHHATAALQDIGTPEALDAVVAYYIQRSDHPEALARLRAAESLKNIGTPEALEAAIPALVQLLNNPEAWVRLRVRAARALKDIGSPEALEAAIPVLMQLLNDPDAWERLSAARVLKDIGTPEALEAVKKFEKRRW